MTLTEAWSELGLEPGADAETVRRAYLRLVRTRKPESDPQGFQRARQAYELARAGVDFEALARESIHPFPFAEDAEPSRPGGEPGPPPSLSPNEAALEGFVAAWNAVPERGNQETRLEIAREAVAALPDEPRAHWLLVTTLSRSGNDATLADALRAGWRAGGPDFLEALLLRLPALALREEVEAGYASGRPALQLAAAAASVTWKDSRSAEVVIELCQAALADRADTGGDRVRELPLERMLDVVLALHLSGAPEAAARAQTAIRNCLQESGLELDVVGGPLGGVWTLGEELASLPADFPQPLRAAFATGTRAGDLSTAFYDVVTYIDRHRATVRKWSKRLAKRSGDGPALSAPNVAGILSEALAYQRKWKFELAWFRLGFLKFLIVPMSLAFMRHCLFQQTTSHPSGSAETAAAARRYSRPPKPRLEPSVGLVRDAAEQLCGPQGPRRGEALCGDVGHLLLGLTTTQCDEVDLRLTALKGTFAEGSAHKPRAQSKALSQAQSKAQLKTAEIEARLMTRAELSRFKICPAGTPNPPKETER